MSDGKKSITMKDMCETIVESGLLRYENGSPPTAKEIFNYSFAGELSMVFEWYKEADMRLNIIKTDNPNKE